MPNKRAVAGWHRGDPILVLDEPSPVEVSDRGMAACEIWVTDSTPPDLHAAAAIPAGEWKLEPPASGTVFRVVTLDPGATSGAHMTQTLDYLVLISGNITLIVGEVETVLNPGDVVVLNGTPHNWINNSDSPCVMAAVLISAIAEREHSSTP